MESLGDNRLKSFCQRQVLAAQFYGLICLGFSSRIFAEADEVDLALVLAVDCSFSVDAKEFALQMQGLGQACEFIGANMPSPASEAHEAPRAALDLRRGAFGK